MRQRVTFRGYRCQVNTTQYRNGNTAVLLIDVKDGAIVASASVNVDGVKLPPDQFVVKDYSENEGMLKALLEAGIVEETGRTVRFGIGFSILAPVCRLKGGSS